MVRKKFRLWLAETHGSQFELMRHFLSQQLVNELLSSEQVKRLVITLLCVLGCIGPLIVRLYVPKYAYLQDRSNGDLYVAAVHADRLFFISLSMIAAGMASVAQWQGLFPNRQDYLALKPLPIRLYQVFVARFLASFIIVAVVLLDLNFAASILFPWLTSGRWQFPPFGVHYVMAHAAATFSAGLFVYFATGALQGVLMNVLSARTFDRVSVLIQAVLATALLVAIPYALDMPNWHNTLAARPSWMSSFPPVWFLGLYKTLLGTHDAYFRQLCETALMGLGAVFLLFVATNFVSYRRHASRALEQGQTRRAGRWVRDRAAKLPEVFITSSRERATFVFALQTLRGSHRHKLVAACGVAVAVVLTLQTAGSSILAHLGTGQYWQLWQLESVLAMPLVMSAILISTLCYVFQLPAELKANWIFRMAESSGRAELLNGVERLLICCGLLPVLLFTAPLEILGFGWVLAIAHLTLVAVLMLLLIEFRLNGWHRIPFACSYVPGRRNFWQTAGAYSFLFGAVIPTMTYFEMRFLQPFVLFACGIALGFVYATVRSARQIQWRLVPLLFDESDEPLIRAVRLNQD
ncbi:MAG: hypothetical protein ACLPPV_03200 [Candidatus Korobacteraceae bacterium]|jgi:hypothetical protein